MKNRPELPIIKISCAEGQTSSIMQKVLDGARQRPWLAGEIMKGGNMQYVEWASEKKLTERHEAHLDERCRKIARELLAK